MKKRLLPPIDNFYVTYSAVFSFALLLFFDTNGLIFYTIAAISIHEAGHLAAIAWFDGSIKSVSIKASGLEMKLSSERCFSNVQEIIIRICGPIAGIIASIICANLGRISADEGFFMLSGANLTLAIINMLPLRQTDGGIALYYILATMFGTKRPTLASKIVNIITYIQAWIIITLGIVILILTKSNITLIIVGIYILLNEDYNYM